MMVKSKSALFVFLIVVAVLFTVLMAWAQQGAAPAKPAEQPAAKAAQGGAAAGGNVARGKYIVENVAMCTTCHTPRLANGAIDTTHLLEGAPVYYQAAQKVSDWPQICPRIGGTPPATDEDMVTLLTTAVWIDGKPLRDPMPKFHMTREDAQAVVAFLKSLK
jgi:mono/diheme cytochrome c family protein